MASTPTSRRARVFGDSSVLFTASHSPRGSARDLVIAALRASLRLYVSDFVLDETDRNLGRKTPAVLPAFFLLRQALASFVVNPTPAQVRRAAAVVDPKDAPIVAGAIRARARYLATYDRRHLLSMRREIGQAFGIVTATPDEILQELFSK